MERSSLAAPELAEPTALAALVAQLRDDNNTLREELGFMRGQAFRDQLTGLFSRRYLTDHLIQEIIDTSKDANVVLALCDIDDFKAINDIRGHQSGDIAIVCIADMLDDLAGGHPVIRWGGEEMLVVFLSTPDHEALRTCEDIRAQIAAYRIDDGMGEVSCTVTFGMGTYDHRLTFDENFVRVDQALYRGKETGKNCCVFPHFGATGQTA